jgi:hypothetical protein
MLLVDPLKRITIPEIRQHPWFNAHLPRYLAVMQADAANSTPRLEDDMVAEVVRLGGWTGRPAWPRGQALPLWRSGCVRSRLAAGGWRSGRQSATLARRGLRAHGRWAAQGNVRLGKHTCVASVATGRGGGGPVGQHGLRTRLAAHRTLALPPLLQALTASCWWSRSRPARRTAPR